MLPPSTLCTYREANAEHAVQLRLRKEDLAPRAHAGVEHTVEVIQGIRAKRLRQPERGGVCDDAEDGECEGGRRDEREDGRGLD